VRAAALSALIACVNMLEVRLIEDPHWRDTGVPVQRIVQRATKSQITSVVQEIAKVAPESLL